MSPKWSNIAKVSSFFKTWGCSSGCAKVASTYHLSSIWIFFLAMACPGGGAVPRRASGGDPLLAGELAVLGEVVFGHHARGEAPLEGFPAGAPVYARDVAGGGD